MEPAENLPDRLRDGTHGANCSALSSDSFPTGGAKKDALKEWVRKAKSGPLVDRDPGAIARAESRLADPGYPDDEILEIVARNILLRERF